MFCANNVNILLKLWHTYKMIFKRMSEDKDVFNVVFFSVMSLEFDNILCCCYY